jgi:hypothetical protein
VHGYYPALAISSIWLADLLQKHVMRLFHFLLLTTAVHLLHRFAVLAKVFQDSNNDTTKTLKNLSVTRWCAHDDACSALDCGWEEIQEALEIITEDMTEKPLVRNDAEGLLRHFRFLETAFMTTLWSFLLHRFKATSSRLQAVDIDLCAVVELYESLIDLVQKCHDDFDEFERQTMQKENTQYAEESDRKRRKMQNDETVSFDRSFYAT